MSELVKRYNENNAEIARLAKVREEEWDNFKKETEKIKSIFWDKQRKLQEKEDNLLGALEKLNNQFYEVTNTRIAILNEPIEKVKRILTFLKMETSDLTIDDEGYKPQKSYRDIYFEPLGFLIDDEFLKVKLYIIGNDKPKNKYSLIAIGKCSLPFVSFQYRYSSCLPSFGYHDCDIKTELRSEASVDELKGYYEKRRTQILATCKQNYDEVKAEYLEVRSEYTLADFEGIEGVNK